MTLWAKTISVFQVLGWLLMAISIFLGLESNQVLIMWVSLEISMLGFISFSMDSSKSKEIVKLQYFVIQSLGSFIFILGWLVGTYEWTTGGENIFILSSLVLKLGVPPMHMWVLSMTKNMDVMLFLIMSTVQKIIPLLFMMGAFSSSTHILGLVSLLIGMMGMYMANRLLDFMAFSSIVTSGWLLLGSPDGALSLFYLGVYTLFTLFFIMSCSSQLLGSVNSDYMGSSFSSFLILVVSVFSMAGMPPMLSFFIKLKILMNLSHLPSSFITLSILVMLGMMIWCYIKLVTSFILLEKKSPIFTQGDTNSIMLGFLWSMFLVLNYIILVG